MYKNINQAVVYVGGFGTRIKKFTKKVPKPLIKVNQKPFLDYILKNLSRHGFTEVVLLCYYKSNIFFSKYNNKIIYNLKIKCIKERTPLGTGGALLNAKKYLKENFLLCNGDTYFDINLNDLCLNFTRLKKIIFVAIKKIKKNNRYAAFDIKKNQIISLNAQKKNYSLINSGNYVVSKKILKYLEKNCSLENDIFKKLIKKKQFFGKVYNKPLNLFIDIGIYTDLNRSPKFLKKVMQKRALFLDRDGVINKDTGYVHEKQKFIWRKNIFRFIKKYNDNGYYVFVVSNQSGIGRGYYKESDLFKLNFWINQQLRRKGANIDEFFFAPFFKNSKLKKYRKGKKLRKPNTGMIEIAKKKWDIDMKNSTLIGDQKTDKLTAINAGVNFKILKFKSILK